MRYAEWKALTDEQRKNSHWRHHPRVKAATIFSVLFAIVFAAILLRVFQNRRMHVNRKPNDKEAFTIAKVFVKDHLKQPATSTFKRNSFKSLIDTAHNSYQISSSVNEQDSSGKMIEKEWQIKLAYTGGDWADQKSWTIKDLQIQR